MSPGLVIGYAVGLVGWVWDYLEHLGTVQLGLGATPAHYLMYLGLVVAVAALVRPWARVRLAYAWLAASVIVLMFVQPVAGSAALLVLPLRSVWLHAKEGSTGRWPAVAALGAAVVLAGFAADWFWHAANPGVSEHGLSMLRLPGHRIQLAGWLVGLAGAVVARGRPPG